jgi:hypothetical protein
MNACSFGALGAVAHGNDPPPALPHLHHQHAHLRIQRQLHSGAGKLSHFEVRLIKLQYC